MRHVFGFLPVRVLIVFERYRTDHVNKTQVRISKIEINTDYCKKDSVTLSYKSGKNLK